MDALKTAYFYVAYTLYFLRWLVIGRVAVTLIAGRRRNVLTDLFFKFTQPLYDFVKRALPFTRVSPEKQETPWGLIEGFVPIVLVVLLWLIEKAFRVLVSVYLLSRQ